MRTEQVIYLAEISQTNSLHKAAERLHLSVQALSASMNALEKELGATLLTRAHQGTFLTPTGEVVLSAGMDFVRVLHKIKNEKENSLLNQIKQLEIGVSSGVAERDLPQIVSALFRDYPQLKLSHKIVKLERLCCGELSLSGSLLLLYQIIFAGEELLTLPKDLYVFVPLREEKYYCIAHEKFLISRKETISLKELSQCPIVIYEPTRKLLDSLLQSVGEKKKIIYVEQFAVYQQMLRDGNGVGLSTAKDFQLYSSGKIKLIPFKEELWSVMGYVTDHKSSLSEEQKAFCCYLKELYLRI